VRQTQTHRQTINNNNHNNNNNNNNKEEQEEKEDNGYSVFPTTRSMLPSVPT